QRLTAVLLVEPVALLQSLSEGWVLFVELPTHADVLRALTREEEGNLRPVPLGDDAARHGRSWRARQTGSEAATQLFARAPARRGVGPGSHSLSVALTKKGLSARPSSGFGSWKWRLGGSCLCLSASTVLTSPATPAAASRWPMLVLTEPKAHESFRPAHS